MTVTSIRNAWEEVQKIFPTDYEYDASRSERAGYPIYYSAATSMNAWISDLGNRMEVNLPDGKSVDIWIKAPEEATTSTSDSAEETGTAEAPPKRNGVKPQSGSSVFLTATPWNMSMHWTTKSARTPL